MTFVPGSGRHATAVCSGRVVTFCQHILTAPLALLLHMRQYPDTLQVQIPQLNNALMQNDRHGLTLGLLGARGSSSQGLTMATLRPDSSLKK